ncbi:MAG: amino acid permease [Bryobacteraceae bacterium]|nr:amino acid permease [Bryobacteraceae bacterium]MDW8376730.1 amino acid permease [Bryobacterales bacterium]
MNQLFRTKSIDALIASSHQEGRSLARTLGPWSLTALGIGAVIGSGIFILTGTAAAGETLSFPSLLHAPVLDILMNGPNAISQIGRPGAGPGIALSFFLVACVCGLAALCYAELASMIPIAGSAYTYSYATLGEIFAWIIGWDLILEYAVSNMAVAVGFSAYFNKFLEGVFGFQLPKELSEPIFVGGQFTGSWFNLPAFLVLMLISWVLARGVRESAGVNNLMVVIKVSAILIFLFAAGRSVNPQNWTPFMPNGFSGVLTGGAIVFFTYIGFDSVSTAGEECKNPQRDLPFGIIASLVICTVLYVAVSLVLTGVQNWRTLNNAAPVANALQQLGFQNALGLVTTGALFGMLSSLLVFQYGQARVWFAMSRDGLLPAIFSRVHPRFKTPHVSTWVAGFLVGIPGGIWDIGTFADLSNIGTLFAFALVSAGVLVLRRTQPGRRRGFRVPLSPWIPLLSIFFCGVLMLSLPLQTWLRFFAWLGVGLVIYFLFGRKRSALASS